MKGTSSRDVVSNSQVNDRFLATTNRRPSALGMLPR